MKLTGNKSKGRHLNKNASIEPDDNFSFAEIGMADQKIKKEKKPKSRKRKMLAITTIVLAVVIVGAGCLYFYLRTAIETMPPARENPTENVYFTPVDPSIPALPKQTPSSSGRVEFVRNTEEFKYTFLLFATDDGNGNTDVIMAVTMDITNHTLEIVSIPRDTLSNVSWYVKKANSIYANMRAQNNGDDDLLDESMDATIDAFADILGFKVDYWFIVDMKAVVALINAIEGVDYNVPVNMNYDDVQAGLSIHFSQGPQHLNGQQALELLRFRRYADADIGRIGTQQDFLMTAAQQILAKKSSLDVIELAKIFLDYVKTDIALSDLIWFGREFLKLDTDDIRFGILPGNYWDSVYGDSYVSIYVDEWLELVNSRLNPYSVDITPEDVSILTRGADGRLYVTDGNRHGSQDWGSGVGQGYSGGGSGDSSATESASQAVDSGNDPMGDSGDLPGDTGDVPGSEATDEPPDDDIDPSEEPTDEPGEPTDEDSDEAAPPTESGPPEEELPPPPDAADEIPAPIEEAPSESAPPEIIEE